MRGGGGGGIGGGGVRKQSLRVFATPLDALLLRDQQRVQRLTSAATSVSASPAYVVPLFVHAAVQYLLQPTNLQTQGIFRVSGDQQMIAHYRDALDNGLFPRCSLAGKWF
jgi:hypothetical protein